MQNKTVFISGHFNVIHPGHLRLFRFAKECGNRLVVGVESDRLAGKSAHISEQLRLDGVASNSYVDQVLLIDRPVVEIISELRPDIVVKGKEHEIRYNPERQILDSYGGQLLFSSGEAFFSSLDLIRREFTKYNGSYIKHSWDYLNRNDICKEYLKKLCEGFDNLKVVVVGDLIVDEYITCQPLGMSQEDPTIVVTPIDTIRFVGGAGIVAAHAAGLGANVEFISVSGQDEAGIFCENELYNFDVKCSIMRDSSRPTTLKQRYRSGGKSLLRVSHVHQDPISSELQEKFLKFTESKLVDASLLVFSDFNYGCLPQSLVKNLFTLGIKHKVIMAADSQSSSQTGDISRFQGMDLITPTEREARIATRNQEDGLVVLAEKLRLLAMSQNILLKMGEEGVLVHSCRKTPDEFITDQVPALNSNPKDVAGAGDSMLITSAMAMACGATVLEAAYLGSMAAAIQVGRVGNMPLKKLELIQEL